VISPLVIRFQNRAASRRHPARALTRRGTACPPRRRRPAELGRAQLGHHLPHGNGSIATGAHFEARRHGLVEGRAHRGFVLGLVGRMDLARCGCSSVNTASAACAAVPLEVRRRRRDASGSGCLRGRRDMRRIAVELRCPPHFSAKICRPCVDYCASRPPNIDAIALCRARG